MQHRGGLVGLLVGLAVLSFVKSGSAAEAVYSCNDLLQVLLESSETGISVVGNLQCSEANDWPAEVRIDRDVMIIGDTFGESQLSIPDATTFSVVSSSFLTFSNLLLTVRTLDERTALPFIEVEQGSEVFVENTIIVSESCQGSRFSRNGQLERNGEVLVLNTQGEEIVHSCNTAHICQENGRIDPNVIRSFEASARRTNCQNDNVVLASSESDSETTLLWITVLMTVVFAVLVVCLVGAIIFLLLARYGNDEKEISTQKSEETESSEEQSYEPPSQDLRKLESAERDLRKLESAERGELERQEIDQQSGFIGDHRSLSNWNFKLSDIEIKEPLGRGSFGKVYKGEWQGTDVAVKCIAHAGGILESRNEPFEAYLSRQVSHPNVVQTFIVHTVPVGNAFPIRNETTGRNTASEWADKETSNTSITSTDDMFGSMAKGPGAHEPKNLETWIVLEYCDRGSLARAIHEGLFQFAHEGTPRINLVHAVLTALDIAYAMMYLHNVRIIHGDLKAANILLKSDAADPRGFVCKVGDFGLSRFLADESHIETFTCGTITHMPPELLKGGVLTPAADVYSFAILMWELLTGVSPYGSKTHGEIVLNVVNRRKRPPIPDYCSDGYAELLEDCWRQSHRERPGFPEIVDRLKDLLEEETANQLDTFEQQSTPVGPLYSQERSLASVELPEFPSCQNMSCDYGWTLEPTDGSSRVLHFPEDFDFRSTPISSTPEER